MQSWVTRLGATPHPARHEPQQPEQDNRQPPGTALAHANIQELHYRREETAYPAGWLYDRLADRFGGRQVFKDVDSIQLGDDFVEVITRAVGSCDVLVALIGDQWLTITDAHGRRRLDDPDDFVRLEIEAALTRKVRVIPILVDGARMPRADELPDSLVKLGTLATGKMRPRQAAVSMLTRRLRPAPMGSG